MSTAIISISEVYKKSVGMCKGRLGDSKSDILFVLI